MMMMRRCFIVSGRLGGWAESEGREDMGLGRMRVSRR